MANRQLIHNLLKYREGHNYTQDKVSKYLNISRQAYSNYETGKRNPDIDLLVKLTKLYGITLDQLVIEPYNRCNVPHSTGSLTLHESQSYYKMGATQEDDTFFLFKEDIDHLLIYREADEKDREFADRILTKKI